MEPIELNYTFTHQEARLAIRETTQSVIKFFKWIPWVGASLALSQIILTLAIKKDVSEVVVPVIFGLFLATLPWSTDWIANHRARRLPNLNSDVSWTITESELRTSSKNESSQFSWETITRIQEREQGFLLFPMPQLAYWLPKSAFQSQGDIARFRELAMSKPIPFTSDQALGCPTDPTPV